MNDAKLNNAKTRQLIAGAKAVGWMQTIATFDCKPSPAAITSAAEIVAEWDSATKAIGAAINERDPKELAEAVERR